MDSTFIVLLPESVIADSCDAISESVNENVQHSFSTINISEPLLNGLTVDTQEIAELHQSTENNSGNTVSEKICSAKDISSTTDINEALIDETIKDLGEISKFPQSEVENSFNVSSENQVDGSDNNSSTNVNGKSTTETTSDNLENESGSFKNDDNENPDSEKKEGNVTSIVDTNISTSRNKRKSSSLPYYRQPKPNFYEYTEKLHEKLNPVIRFESDKNNSSSTVMSEDSSLQTNLETSKIQVSPTVKFSKDASFTATEKSTGKITISSKRPTPDIIILDDYKAQKQRINCFKNQSAFSLKRESTNTSPWQKYVTLKVQLKEKIMLKKEASFLKRKEEQKLDEHFDDEENILSDQSEKDSSDEDSQEDTEDVVLKELLSKGCKEETNDIDVSETRNCISDEGIVNDSQDPMQFSLPSYQPGGGFKNFPVDSQDPMQCFSLPSYQPGGGFQNSVTENDLKRKFTDSNINDSEIHDSDNHSQEEEEEGMFDSVLKEIGAEQFSSQDSDERVVIQGWNSLPYDENEGSQFGDEALQFCSGKFVSQDDAIPWTSSSSLYLKSQVSNKDGLCSPTLSMPAEDSDKLNESESKHSSPPAKKRKLFLDEKILNLENEDNLSISTKIENDTLKKSQIDTYSCNEYKSDDDSEEEEEIIRPTKKVKSSLVGKLWDSDDEDEPIEQSKFNGVSNKEHVSSDDSGEENEHDDNLSESSNKDMDYFKENNSMKDDNDLYDEGIPDKQKQNGLEEDAGKKFEIQNFFENEAELSGEEGSSDENEDDLDEFVQDEYIADDNVANEEKLRKELGTIHFKRQQDEDDQLIRQIKNDFLPEGELYSENGSRKKRYVWNNVGDNDNEFTETKSDSEEEEVASVPADYLKWQQEEKKVDIADDDHEEVEMSKSFGLKVDIIGKVSVTRCQTIAATSISASPLTRRGSFLNSSIGKNMKFLKEFGGSTGAVSRKNFVFSSPKPDLPSKSSDEVKSTKHNSSIFHKIQIL